MVQIKLRWTLRTLRNRSLYIPYGSNKTHHVVGRGHLDNSLYIPYGSNKTLTVYVPYKEGILFISHMVQIKRIDTREFFFDDEALYPIWFK